MSTPSSTTSTAGTARPRRRGRDVRVRVRGVVALAGLLAFSVVGGVHRFAPDLWTLPGH